MAESGRLDSDTKGRGIPLGFLPWSCLWTYLPSLFWHLEEVLGSELKWGPNDPPAASPGLGLCSLPTISSTGVEVSSMPSPSWSPRCCEILPGRCHGSEQEAIVPRSETGTNPQLTIFIWSLPWKLCPKPCEQNLCRTGKARGRESRCPAGYCGGRNILFQTPHILQLHFCSLAFSSLILFPLSSPVRARMSLTLGWRESLLCSSLSRRRHAHSREHSQTDTARCCDTRVLTLGDALSTTLILQILVLKILRDEMLQ